MSIELPRDNQMTVSVIALIGVAQLVLAAYMHFVFWRMVRRLHDIINSQYQAKIEALHNIIESYSEDEGYIPSRVLQEFKDHHTPWCVARRRGV